MTLSVNVPPAVEAQLAERAAAAGATVEDMAAALLADAVLRAPRTFDEILAPFRQSVADSGMTDDELDAFFREVRQEVWDEKHGGRG